MSSSSSCSADDALCDSGNRGCGYPTFCQDCQDAIEAFCECGDENCEECQQRAEDGCGYCGDENCEKCSLDAQRFRPVISLVIINGDEIGDGNLPPTPIATCSCKPDPAGRTSTLNVYQIGEDSKYYPQPGTPEQMAAVLKETWLPMIIASEMSARMENGDGTDEIPLGEYIEEACNEEGTRMLLVERVFLQRHCKALKSWVATKHLFAQKKLVKFYREYVVRKSNMAIARGFLRDGMSLAACRLST
jgi:hypothetical protein